MNVLPSNRSAADLIVAHSLPYSQPNSILGVA